MSQSVCGQPLYRDTCHFKKSDKSSQGFVVIKKIACWNVRSMIDHDTSDCPERRSALITSELLRFEIDIAALSETRLADTGSFDEIVGVMDTDFSGQVNHQESNKDQVLVLPSEQTL